jgi:hypothetical protein
MKQIKLTKDKFAMVDDEDFEFINQWKWSCAKGIKYAARRTNNRIIYMHRLITNCPEKLEVDHINRDGLDNRKVNLRICTSAENRKNHKILSNNKSGYNGVSKTPFNTWHTCISLNGKTIHLGTYKNVVDAALAYNVAANHYFGEFARLNNVERMVL